jgi:micrococcal nuclease
MSNLFALFFLLSFISIFIFLIKPLLLIKWFKITWPRKKILSVFGSLIFIFMILVGMTAPEIEQEAIANPLETTILENPSGVMKETTEVVVGIENEELFLVTRVIDGDTIEIEGGDKVRYIGIDTPETKHPSKPVGCYGKEAEVKNRELVEGQKVRLEKDVSETDKYGRLLRYVYLDEVMINEFLVKEGYAQASSYPPDIKHQDQFNDVERQAREEERGLWSEICNPESSPTPAPTHIPEPTLVPIQPTMIKTTEPAAITPPTTDSYGCNCKKTCSQMSSCDEAYYQLNTCGCSVRDGDDDGVPCESVCPGG